MDVLVVNCGSSSLKAAVLDAASGERRVEVLAERIGEPGSYSRIDGGEPRPIAARDHGGSLAALLPEILSRSDAARLGAVAHRVVHGGERFVAPVRIDDEVERAIEALCDLAPLHNPINLAGIRAARRLLPAPPHVAVFDTAFHATLPRRARSYALPAALAEKHGLRRYGFHGTSHAWVAGRAAEFLGSDLRDLRLVTCHLGNGCSVSAVEWGRSVETSMGMTPVEGLVMGTRCGDVDAGILIELLRREGWGPDELDRVLNRDSGLRGLSGVGNDVRDIEERARAGDERCRLALHVFGHRLRKYIGAYAAVMGGLDAVVFTGGIGEHSALLRHRAAQRLEFLGARLDEERNREARVDAAAPVAEISASGSRVRLLVVASDEAFAMARAVDALLRAEARPLPGGAIPVSVTSRHVHLSAEAVAALFGPGHALTPARPLTQPGEFVARESVRVVGPRRALEDVPVVGPLRPRCQVEIGRADEFQLGLDAPVRASGDLASTPGATLEGPAGRLALAEGVICGRSQLLVPAEQADALDLAHRDLVDVALEGEPGSVLRGVVVHLLPGARLELRASPDEAVAAGLEAPAGAGPLAPCGRTARLLRRA
jgi:acetate kinase